MFALIPESRSCFISSATETAVSVLVAMNLLTRANVGRMTWGRAVSRDERVFHDDGKQIYVLYDHQTMLTLSPSLRCSVIFRPAVNAVRSAWTELRMPTQSLLNTGML
jgi:hypothetical protein